MTSAKQIGRRIGEARRRMGLTQRQLADRVGVEPMQVSRWERGVHEPSIDSLLALARELGRTERWLARGERGPDPVEPPPHFLDWLDSPEGQTVSDDERRELLEAAAKYGDLPPIGWHYLLLALRSRG